MRADGPSVKVMERAYVTDRVRHTNMTAADAREEFRRGIKTVERASAEKAWDQCSEETHEWYRTMNETLYTAPENPYRREETE